MNFNLYTAKARTHTEEDFRELVDQVQLLQAKLTAKTEALLRVGADLEEAANERRSWKAEAANYERNLQRIELELSWSSETISDLKSAHAAEKCALEARVAKAEVRLKSTDNDSNSLRAEIRELQKDCKMYRQKLAKVEVLRMESEEAEAGDVFAGPSSSSTDCPSSGRLTSSSREARGSMPEQRLENYEKLKHEHHQLETDFQTLLTLKEDSVQEKDLMGKKIERLQTELSYLLNGDTRRIAEDLDDVLAENRFLKAQLNSAQEESDSMKASLAKYRRMAESSDRRTAERNGAVRDRKRSEEGEDGLGDKSSVAVINMKQIREMVSSHSIDLDESDYRAITTILLDLCNDKQMALAHQRKANKILGARLSEVEAKLSKMEVSRSPGRQSLLPSPVSPRAALPREDDLLSPEA